MRQSVVLKPPARLFLLLAPVLSALAVTVLMPVLPMIEASFAASGDAGPMVRALVSSLSLAMILGSFVAGIAADRFGLKPVLILALCVYLGAGLAGCFIPSLAGLLVSRVAVGLAASVIGILNVALIVAAYSGAERDRWIGWISATGTVGSLVIVPLAGFLGNFGWRLVFLLHLAAVPAILLAIIGIRAGRDVAAEERAPAGKAVGESGSPALGLRIWTLVLLAAATGAVINAVPMYLPFHLAAHGEGAPSMIAFAMLASATTGAVVCFAYGWVRRFLSAGQVFAVGLAVGGAGLAMIGLSTSYAAIFLALAVTGTGLGLTMPNLNATAALVSAPAQQTTTIGLVNSAFYAGAPLAQFGLDAFMHGQPAALSILLLAGLSGVLFAIWLAFGGWLAAPPVASPSLA